VKRASGAPLWAYIRQITQKKITHCTLVNAAGSTGAEHKTHNPKIGGSNPATGTGGGGKVKSLLTELSLEMFDFLSDAFRFMFRTWRRRVGTHSRFPDSEVLPVPPSFVDLLADSLKLFQALGIALIWI